LYMTYLNFLRLQKSAAMHISAAAAVNRVQIGVISAEK
jgi:hypothetical protein